MDKLLKLRDVSNTTTLSRSAIYAAIKGGTFPAPAARIGRRVAWLESDIVRWVAERVSASRSEARP